MLRFLLLPAFLVTLLASPGHPQSLGDAAAREKAKRDKRGPTSTRVITGEDLQAGRPPAKKGETQPANTATPTPPPGGSRPEGSSQPEGSSRPSSGVAEGSSNFNTNEAAWRQRAKAQRDAIAAIETSIQMNQDKLSRLMADLEPVGLGDPNRLQTIENMKAQTRQALEKGAADLAAAKKAMQDLEEEARRNNVPAGWLR